MHAGSVAWLFLVSIGASALGGALGMASGIFIVPVLSLFGGLDIHAAVPAGIVSVIACSCGSAAPFLRTGLTNLRVAIVLEVATTLGAVTGVLLAGILSAPSLYVLFAAILVVSARQMMARRHEVLGETEEPLSEIGRLGCVFIQAIPIMSWVAMWFTAYGACPWASR